MSYEEMVEAYVSAVMRSQMELLEEQLSEAIWTQAPDKLDRLIIVDFVPSLNQPGRWVASQWWPE